MKEIFAMLAACSGGIVLADITENYFQNHCDLNPKLAAFLVFVTWASLIYMTVWP